MQQRPNVGTTDSIVSSIRAVFPAGQRAEHTDLSRPRRILILQAFAKKHMVQARSIRGAGTAGCSKLAIVYGSVLATTRN